jgi:hypothetical protein|tara:strand:+ start:5544 stop:6659 length:1116 start_codon:yes stop_codon:yes gene_type:complete|mmetsp:Transcript_2946/g.10316  ORF Transcript_2946/g.10316 Transcript_2946/m.10316 type:complete len:372 (-) Transcript_2946:85-1200(-)
MACFVTLVSPPVGRANTQGDFAAQKASSRRVVLGGFGSRWDRNLARRRRVPNHVSPSVSPDFTRAKTTALRASGEDAALSGNENIATRFFAAGGLKKAAFSDPELAKLLQSVAKHLMVLSQIPDLLLHLHVEFDSVEVRASKICDGRGVFATRAIPAHTLVTTYPATNEVSLMSNVANGDGASSNSSSESNGESTTKKVHTWRGDTYTTSQPTYAMCNGHSFFGDNALRLQADPERDPQPGFLGHLINDVLMPPTDGTDVKYAHAYLTRTTNETNCHAVPFPSGLVSIATSRAIAKGDELTMSYTFGYDASFMSAVNSDLGLKKAMLTNAFAADMKVSSAKMEQLTAETMKRHAEAEHLSRELLVDAAEEE